MRTISLSQHIALKTTYFALRNDHLIIAYMYKNKIPAITEFCIQREKYVRPH